MPPSLRERALRYVRSEREQTGAAISDASLGHQAVQAAEVARRLRAPHPLILRDPVGSGKTVVALAAARLLLDDEIVDYVLLRAPNLTVADQWAERALAIFGENVQTGAGPWKKNALLVRTTATLPGKASPGPSRTLVIVDEAHRGLQHDTEGGKAIAKAAAGARLLLVTATPFQLSTAGLLTMLGVAGNIDKDAAEALHAYGKRLVAVAKAWEPLVGVSGIETQVMHVEAVKEQAAKALRKHLVGHTKIHIPPAPKLQIDSVPLGTWETAYHTARILPELLNAGKTDAYQRGLTSCSEAVWDEAWAVGAEVARARSEAVDKGLLAFLDELQDRLGAGTDHPKVEATVDFVQRQHQAGYHVLIFCAWLPTQRVLGKVLTTSLEEDNVVAPTGAIPAWARKRFCRPPDGNPMVLVLTDRFSESIDLDGGNPSIVHHDLSWNPVRLVQRWGRVVRIRTGFKKIPPDRTFSPVLNVEVDRRLATIVRGRTGLADLMIPSSGEGESAWELPTRVIKRVAAHADTPRTGSN